MYLAICNQKHDDCFARTLGHCAVLSRGYANGDCPFYQTREEVEEGRRKAHERLEELNRHDLINKLERNPTRDW